MFSISKSTSYKWPVSVETPADGGKWEKQTFDVEFKRLSQSRIKKLIVDAGEGNATDNEICREVVLDWSGIKDADGEPLPFSEAARDLILDEPGVAGAIVTAMLASLSGNKTKN